MRLAITLGAGALLCGCVQQPTFQPAPIQLQAYPPPVVYRTNPAYRPPMPDLYSAPLPPPNDLQSAPTPPSEDTGAIPLQQMPAPAPDTAATPSAAARPTAEAAPAAPVVRPPVSGRGSNVPLEGFRPMRGQTRYAP